MLRGVGRALERAAGRGSVFHTDSQTFVVLFRRTSAAAAAERLERVRQAVPRVMLDVRVREDAPRRSAMPESPAGELPAVEFADCTVAVTISAGVAETENRAKTPRDVLSAANEALQNARKRGHHVTIG
jgi:GGDEF domain-containing protein